MSRIDVPALDANALRTRWEPLFARTFSEDLERAYSHVDRLCLHLCFRVAQDCRLLEFPAEPLASLIARVNVAPDAIYLVQRVLDILCEEGFARRTDNGIERLRPCPPDESDRVQLQARAACPEAVAIFELIGRCREHAADFVTGKESGLASVFARGDFELWKRVHSVDKVMSIYADLIAPMLEAVARPRMRLLEVGGGVGAVLQRCLPTLERSGFDHYCFSDLGQSFVQAAQHRYGGDRRLNFARIDLDLPLRDQGLAPESFDVVIGVNVLHVAKRLSFSLRELLGVLKPHGHLILSEGSPPDRFRRWRLDLVFAFLRGWWDVATELPWRPDSGFLLPSQWQGVLLGCGYDPVHLLPGEAWFRGPCRGGAILARKQPDRIALAAQAAAVRM
jgi:SAM-dependent methyltransferase